MGDRRKLVSHGRPPLKGVTEVILKSSILFQLIKPNSVLICEGASALGLPTTELHPSHP